MKLYRQGDVMFRRIKSFPAGERRVRQDGIVMHGEVTGHVHQVSSLLDAEVFDCGDGLFLSAANADRVSIIHPEHGTVALPNGKYQVIRQREYSPAEIRNVMD